MKTGRDFSIVYHINSHYRDLVADLSDINSIDEFSNVGHLRKSILFDFFQIGELLNHLSPSFINDFGSKEIEQVISIRNKIVHGYRKVQDEKVFPSLKSELPIFIEKLNDFTDSLYHKTTKNLIGKKVKVFIEEDDKTLYTTLLTNIEGRFQEVRMADQKDQKTIKDNDEVTVIDIISGQVDILVAVIK